MSNLKKYFVEFLGTFIFLSVIIATGEAVPIGLALMSVIYWGGAVSGGNYNPAVSFMLYLNNKLPFTDFLMYIAFQLLGGFAAYLYYSNFIAKNKVLS